MRVRVSLLVAAVTLALAAPAHAAVQPYGTDDAGGFRNVLPAGEAGTDNAADPVALTGGGTPPPHWAAPQPLYENPPYAPPPPTHQQAAHHYKDAAFGLREGGT